MGDEDPLIEEKGLSMEDKGPQNAKVRNRRMAMVPALVVQGGQIVYTLMVSVPRVESLIVAGIGLAWLILMPGLGAVVYLIICQAINTYLASLVAFNVPRASPYIVIPLFSILLSILAIILMIRGLRTIRR
jgi:hypothetical protein